VQAALAVNWFHAATWHPCTRGHLLFPFSDIEINGNSSSGSARGLRPCYRRLLLGEDPEGVVCSIIVMEYCDGGTLRQALKRGLFHRQLATGEVGVDLCAILEVCMGLRAWHLAA
jgi:serine/threonine protein kinase